MASDIICGRGARFFIAPRSPVYTARMDFSTIQHFKLEEFSSPDLPGSGANMDPGFVRKLDDVRRLCGFPLTVHSGFRTPEHNAKVGGVDSSAHTAGFAADIGALSAGAKYVIVKAALAAGFTRIGIGSTFVHLDSSPVHPANVIWIYPTLAKRTNIPTEG